MKEYIKKLEAKGLHGRFDVNHEFQKGVNIIYGKNGTGKTTLLHIIANALNNDFKRFVYLKFDKIKLTLNDNTVIDISQRNYKNKTNQIAVKINGKKLYSYKSVDVEKEDEAFRKNRMDETIWDNNRNQRQVIIPVQYFPAFRSMIEAWSAQRQSNYEFRRLYRHKLFTLVITNFARELFGEFVPIIDYPSIMEISKGIDDQINIALLKTGEKDNELLLGALKEIVKVFAKNEGKRNVLEPISPKDISDFIKENPTSKDIQSKSDFFAQAIEYLLKYRKTNNSISIITNIYFNIWKKKYNKEKNEFSQIDNYVNAINKLLEGKEIFYGKEKTHLNQRLRIQFNDGKVGLLKNISSGERQIMTILYAATRMHKKRIFLIDEPEISLHVDWQRLLIEILREQLSDIQIIACTHSPLIGADYPEEQQELKLHPVSKNKLRVEEEGEVV